MKHIVVDARKIRLSTGRYTRKILDYLQKIDTENTYTVLVGPEDKTAWQPRKSSKNFQVQVVDYDHYSLGEQTGFIFYLRSLKPDLVWFTMPQQPLFYFGRKVTTIHDLILLRHKNTKRSSLAFNFKQFVFKIVIKVFARTSTLVLTVTDHAKNDIVRYTGVSEKKVRRTHLSADKISAKPKSVKQLSGKKFLLFVGNAHVHKNLPRLLEAFEKLKPKHPDLHIALAGSMTIHYERLQLLADAMHDAKSIHILGFVDDSELRWLYENAAIYTFPTLDEGFGLPGLEAMQYDVPVAASNASCLPEVYEDSVAYFNPLDPEDMASTINDILSSKQHAQSLIKKGRKQLQKYSWQDTAQQVHSHLMEALEQD